MPLRLRLPTLWLHLHKEQRTKNGIFLIRQRVRQLHRDVSKDQTANSRPEPSQPQPAHNNETFFGIPGPSWLQTTGHHLGSPFRAYGRVSAKRPYLTQFISSLIVYFTGDLSSQYITQRGQRPESPGAALAENYDRSSSIRAICIGGLSSIPSYKWFIYLSTHFGAPAWMPLGGVVSLVTRIVINQCVFAPLFNTYFFGMQSILSGAGAPENLPEDAQLGDRLALGSRFGQAYERIIHTVPISWMNSWKFWPFVTAFSFTFIPIRHRSIFAGGAAVIWQSYLCLLNQRHVDRDDGGAVVHG